MIPLPHKPSICMAPFQILLETTDPSTPPPPPIPPWKLCDLKIPQVIGEEFFAQWRRTKKKTYMQEN